MNFKKFFRNPIERNNMFHSQKIANCIHELYTESFDTVWRNLV